MKGADIGLMILANIPAFYYGTSPNKFFDYLSIGLPILNNYPGWIAGMIRECQCGYAIEPDNPKLFADALEDAADNPEKLQQAGAKALALGRDQFDRKLLAAKFVAWLETVK
jgi:glycosyltransferase involved in cell wall biosynthesis